MPNRQWIAVVPPALLAALGAGVAIVGRSYRIGQLTAMGPGFLPVALGVLLALIGIGLGVRAVREIVTEADPNGGDRPESLPGIRFRPLVAVVAGMGVWALAVERVGLVPATAALVGLASLALPSSRARSVIWLALALGAAGYVLFVMQLGVPLSAFPR
jgi:hypothetical protein